MTSNDGDFGEYELDEDERARAELDLDDPESSDDEPWTPPERQPRGAELIGTETDGGETLDQRILQEEHEVGSAYGNPDDADTRPESEEMVGGDDPDAIPADQDVLGGPASSDERSTATSPEGAAMRVVEGDEGLVTEGDDAEV